MFAKLKSKMMGQDSTLQEEFVAEQGIMRLRFDKPCEKSLFNHFGVLEFNVMSTKISIFPEGYFYNMNGKCYIGVESIPDRFN